MLEEMRAFALLAEEGSIRKVAERLPLTQPAVTRQIQRLEQALGVELLDRRAKPPRLTPAGQEALARSREILAAWGRMREGLSRPEPAGLLRLGVADGLADTRLATLLGSLRKRFPRISLRVSGGWSGALGEQLRRGQLDCAVLLGTPGQPEADAQVLGRERIAVIAAATDKRRSPALEEAAWVLNPEPCDARKRLAEALGQRGARLRVAAEVHHPALQLGLVRAGLGLGLMPRRLVGRKAPRDIAVLPARGLDLGFDILLSRSPHLHAHAPVADALAEGLRGSFA
jgi:DNA-binding transcriptional LysR family regulator